MKTKNGDMPAMPTVTYDHSAAMNGFAVTVTDMPGMTKREAFCLHMGVADTGDEELDAIIRKGNRQKMAVQICNGFVSGDFDLAGPRFRFTDLVAESVSTADALLAELERTK
jgi:hypothetical protein